MWQGLGTGHQKQSSDCRHSANAFCPQCYNVPNVPPSFPDNLFNGFDALVITLQTRNSAVDNTYQPVSLARSNRDVVLYHPITGLVAVAAMVKKYVKSAYGAKSPQFEQVSGLAFTKPGK